MKKKPKKAGTSKQAAEARRRIFVEAYIASCGNATEAVIGKLAKLVHADLRRLYNADGSLKNPHEWPDEVAAAVTSFEATEEFIGAGKDRKFVDLRKKVKVIEPTAALNLAMKHLGLFDKDNAQKGEAEALREFFQAIYGPANKLPIARRLAA